MLDKNSLKFIMKYLISLSTNKKNFTLKVTIKFFKIQLIFNLSFPMCVYKYLQLNNPR